MNNEYAIEVLERQKKKLIIDYEHFEILWKKDKIKKLQSAIDTLSEDKIQEFFNE